MYRPSIGELKTAVELLIPTYKRVNGVEKKVYPSKGELIFVNWKTFGGTEVGVNGVLAVRDTATLTTWFRPDIVSSARIRRSDGAVFEIIGEPENIELRNMFMVFKVERIKGGA